MRKWVMTLQADRVDLCSTWGTGRSGEGGESCLGRGCAGKGKSTVGGEGDLASATSACPPASASQLLLPFAHLLSLPTHSPPPLRSLPARCQAWANEQGIQTAGWGELCGDSEVRRLLQKEIDTVGKQGGLKVRWGVGRCGASAGARRGLRLGLLWAEGRARKEAGRRRGRQRASSPVQTAPTRQPHNSRHLRLSLSNRVNSMSNQPAPCSPSSCPRRLWWRASPLRWPTTS